MVVISKRSSLLFLFTLLSCADAFIKYDVPRPDPFVDPKHDPYNPLKYIASNVLTGIAVALVLAVALTQTWLIFKVGAKWMMPMTIGAYLFALGLSFRFGLHLHPQSKGIYILEYLLVVLSPCAFIAADYVLLGRLAKHLDADRHLLVTSRRITIVFVGSDVTTFLIQAAGGAMSASASDLVKATIGSHVFLAGLVAQLISFSCFTCICLIFLYRIRKNDPRIWATDKAEKWYNSWLALAGALIVSCIGILIRSGFRVVEISEGFQGRLSTSEAFFYGLDTLPLFVACVVYIPFWPGRFTCGPILRPIRQEHKESSSSI
ncbi:hypothetical protein CVT25_012793 [Psilocybe cyanescens]|uniref:Uncharacterized protein n=1 Tax=Psilocybe cyanescens TaxID=93625 RepID=A0A409XLH0_PSICY|nr:hypothetical protein CVT25_012793 [Psilocybe cyanescens]